MFKFQVNGEWRHDVKQKTIKNADKSKYEFGMTRKCFIVNDRFSNFREWNVIEIAKSDQDVFEALACDSFSLRYSREAAGVSNDQDREYDDIWSQDKPSDEFVRSSKGPPLLPPHLLQILLNKADTTEPQNDPVLLPEPSHRFSEL